MFIFSDHEYECCFLRTTGQRFCRSEFSFQLFSFFRAGTRETHNKLEKNRSVKKFSCTRNHMRANRATN